MTAHDKLKEAMQLVLANKTTAIEVLLAEALGDTFTIKQDIALIQSTLEKSAEGVAAKFAAQLEASHENYHSKVKEYTEQIGQTFDTRMTEAVATAKKEIAESSGALNQIKSSVGLVLFTICFAASISVAAVHLTIYFKQTELEQLQKEIATMQDNIAKLDNVRGHIEIQKCDNRPCVEIDDPTQAFGKKGNVFILKGARFKHH